MQTRKYTGPVDFPVAGISGWKGKLPLNPTTLALIDYLRKGGSVPPIRLAIDKNGQARIKDGRHRYLAFKMLGRKTIKALVCRPMEV